MAKSNDFKPITFEKTGDDGKKRTRIAHTPSDAVQLKFDGWRQAKTATKTSTGTSGGATASKHS